MSALDMELQVDHYLNCICRRTYKMHLPEPSTCVSMECTLRKPQVNAAFWWSKWADAKPIWDAFFHLIAVFLVLWSLQAARTSGMCSNDECCKVEYPDIYNYDLVNLVIFGLVRLWLKTLNFALMCNKE